jgi:hypothetical protein
MNEGMLYIVFVLLNSMLLYGMFTFANEKLPRLVILVILLGPISTLHLYTFFIVCLAYNVMERFND